MAQLPPKVPHHQNWPRMPSLTTTTPPPPQLTVPASWVDEFLDFTSARRGTHRRSMSDSVAFLEATECHNSIHGSRSGFDRLDDEQLMSMFSDEFSGGMKGVGPPSSPSGQNSSNDDDDSKKLPNNINNNKKKKLESFPKSEPGEFQSACDNNNTVDNSTPVSITENANTLGNPSDADPLDLDPKRIKRILANRQSAQRSRVRKLQYISELERSVTSLQTEVSTLSPRVAYLDHQRLILNVDNGALKQRMAALAQDKIFKDAHQEALRKEIERLRQIYYHQQDMKTSNNATNCSRNTGQSRPVPDNRQFQMGCTEKEQLIRGI